MRAGRVRRPAAPQVIAARRLGPVVTAALVMAAIAAGLHLPVLTEGALITPAAMNRAIWPWRALPAAPGMPVGDDGAAARLQADRTLNDLLFQVYPWQLHTARSLAAGLTPLWNPYASAGVPFLANPQSAVFYPLHWPVWLLPSMKVFTLALLMKIVLAGVFMAVFLRGLGMGRAPATLGAVSFALCAFMTSRLGFAHTNAAIWLPLLMHAARELARRPAAGPFLLMAVGTAAQFLGGHPQTSLHILLVSTAYFAVSARGEPRPRASAAFFCGAAVLGTAAAAVQLLPSMATFLHGAPMSHPIDPAGVDPSLPPGALLTLLVPDRYGMPWSSTYVAAVPFQALVGYAGAGVVLLAIVALRWARENRFFHVMAATAAILVYSPAWVRAPLHAIPAAGLAANDSLLMLLAFSLAVLGAWSLQRILEQAAMPHGPPDPRGPRGTLMWLAAAASTLVFVILITGGAWGGERGGSAGAASSVVAATALLAALILLRPARRGLYAAALAGLVALDLFLFAFRFNPHADPRRLFPPTGLTDFVRHDLGADMARGGRLMTVGWTLRPDTQMVYRLPSIEGQGARELPGVGRLLDRAKVAEIHRTGLIPEPSRPLLDLAGLRYLVTPPGGVVSGEEMALAYDGPDGRVFVNRRALPRLLWVPEGRRAPDETAALELLASARIDPHRAVLLSGEADEEDGTDAEPSGETGSAAGPSAVVTLERANEGDLTIAVRGAPEKGWLVVSDAWDAGWKAQVDGVSRPVRRANVCFRAVRVPAGDSVVRMTYRPASFVAGAWISSLSLICMLGIALVLSTPLDRAPRAPLP